MAEFESLGIAVNEWASLCKKDLVPAVRALVELHSPCDPYGYASSWQQMMRSRVLRGYDNTDVVCSECRVRFPCETARVLHSSLRRREATDSFIDEVGVSAFKEGAL